MENDNVTGQEQQEQGQQSQQQEQGAVKKLSRRLRLTR